MRLFRTHIMGISKTGFLVNDFDVGYSLVCLPVYLISQVFESETVSILMTNFFSSILGLTSLLIIHKFLTKTLFIESKLSLFICVSLLLGTPLLFYSYSIPQNPHSISAFLITVFFYVILTLDEKKDNFLNYSLAGILLGIISCVRLQNVIVAIPFIIDVVIKVWKTKNFKKYFFLLTGFFLFFIVGLSPQLINSIILFATLTPPKLYTLSINKYLLSSVYETLFSCYHSVLLWTPVILVSVSGFIFAAKTNSIFCIKMLLVFVTQIIVISSVISPGGGASFGIRYLTDLIFIFGLGLCLLIKMSPQPFSKIIQILTSLCSIWTFILFVLSTTGKIDLLEVYSGTEFFKQVFAGIQNIKINLTPRYVAESDIYFFLTIILLVALLISNKYEILTKGQLNSKIFFVLIVAYILFFNINLLYAGIINRVVYKKEIYQSCLTQEDYQRFYTLAGIKVRLKYYKTTKQKDKFNYYLSLKDKLFPKSPLGKYYANALYMDFKID